MNEHPPQRPPQREPGWMARLALLAGLAVTPKAMGSEESSPRPQTTQPDRTRKNDERTMETLRASIAQQGLASPIEAPTHGETAQPSAGDVGQASVEHLLSEGDVQTFLSSPGDAVERSAQALDDTLVYRDTHLPRLPTLDERRAARREANAAIVREVQHRIDEILSGNHGGTTAQQQELAVALSTAFSMMFDEDHRVLHTYSLDDGVFLDSEPARAAFVPGAFDGVDGDTPDPSDASAPVPEMDPATDDPEDYEEDSEPSAPLDPNAGRR